MDDLKKSLTDALEKAEPDKSQGHFDGPVTIPPETDLVGDEDDEEEVGGELEAPEPPKAV